jgi:hypothetical protein
LSDIEQFVISSPDQITGNRWQVMRPLTPEEYESLKDGISQDGIMSSIIVDANGDVVDGHNRLEAWAELLAEGKPAPSTAPVIRRKDLSDPKAIKAVARKLNLQRRQLSRTDRRIVVKAQIVDTPGESDNAISVMLGVHHSVVEKVREDAVKEGLICTSSTSVDSRGAERPRKIRDANNAKGCGTQPLANNANDSNNNDVEAPTTSPPTPDPSQTTIDEHIEEASENGSPASARDKSAGAKTVKQAVDAGAELPQRPVRTPEQKAYYDLFPYLNSLLELDPASVAQASANPWSAKHSTILFKEVIPWFEQFFETLEKQGKPQIRAIK